ncbi:hypothetical protein LR48_Vigan53s000100 [Vigna angularis]|uniref:Uncharacterized protein n=1 Tax=Phaseolus angularis TaxID=3914 RepID=A0A0L9T4A3_PHAAN|nr:hypothetical protein LR48_Vigan53s000100 [Vigna angularis]
MNQIKKSNVENKQNEINVELSILIHPKSNSVNMLLLKIPTFPAKEKLSVAAGSPHVQPPFSFQLLSNINPGP